jgi:hypothetical protein
LEPYTKENTASRYSDLSERPAILEVVSHYTTLRKSGKEFVGLCPFHSENTPSFNVNEEKGVYLCRSCLEGGDVIRFIQRVEGLDFSAALLHLGMGREKLSSREITRRELDKAARDALALWASDISIRISARMREAGSHAAIAGKILRELPGADRELLQSEIEVCRREWILLEILQTDLFNPAFIFDLWRNRQAVENIAERAA